MRQLIKNIAKHFGYTISRSLPSCIETVEHAIEPQHVKVCFDVGAFRGWYSRELLSAFPLADVHAYEPNPNEFSCLERLAKKEPRLHAHQVALSDTVGTATLSVTTGTASSSLLPPTASQAPLAPEWAQVLKVTKTEHVLTTTLIEEANRLGISQIDFLKIDAQGFEPVILNGALPLLQSKRIRCLQLEVLASDSYTGQKYPHEVFNFCASLGYRLCGIYDPLYRENELSQFDALWVAT